MVESWAFKSDFGGNEDDLHTDEEFENIFQNRK